MKPFLAKAIEVDGEPFFVFLGNCHDIPESAVPVVIVPLEMYEEIRRVMREKNAVHQQALDSLLNDPEVPR